MNWSYTNTDGETERQKDLAQMVLKCSEQYASPGINKEKDNNTISHSRGLREVTDGRGKK